MELPKLGPVVAIDGPAGAGKSSTTRKLAEVLGYIHVDTGALYRVVGLLCTEKGVKTHAPLSQESALQAAEIARSAYFEFKRDLSVRPPNRVYVNGRDVTAEIRTPEMSLAASAVSAVPDVRAALLGLQRRLGSVGRAILEGRDIGTVIFPDADVKFFVTATADERAKRRLKELVEVKGPKEIPSLIEIKVQIERRDHDDATRATAPLRRADDAILIDTTRISLEEAVARMAAIVRGKVRS